MIIRSITVLHFYVYSYSILLMNHYQMNSQHSQPTAGGLKGLLVGFTNTTDNIIAAIPAWLLLRPHSCSLYYCCSLSGNGGLYHHVCINLLFFFNIINLFMSFCIISTNIIISGRLTGKVLTETLGSLLLVRKEVLSAFPHTSATGTNDALMAFIVSFGENGYCCFNG